MTIKLNKIKAIIFDFDGVVVNSEPYYEESIIDVFKENHINIPIKDWENFKGMADKEFFPLMVSMYNFQGDIDILKNNIYDRMKKKLITLNYIDGFKKFFDSIKNEFSIGLVTSTSRNHIEWLTENTQIEDLFELKVTATDVENTKPHPEPYETMAKLLEINPENIIVIEDSINGLISAQKAGMQTIALLTSFTRDKVDFADYIAENYLELTQMFGKS